jgi:homoserine kinase type II
MAVFTQITKAQLETFWNAYDLPAITAFKGIQAGVQNSNFLVEAADDKFILTLYEDTPTGVDPADLPYFLGLMQHLSAKGLSCPTPMARKDASLSGELAGRPAALVSFLSGRGTITPKPTQCKSAGAALARLHIAGDGFALHRANTQGPADWQALFDTCRDRADEVNPGLGQVIGDELARLHADWPQDLPTGIIHADLFPDNVFFINGEVSGLIDFYFACNDILAYDLAIMLNAWCFEADVNFNITKARALLAGYQSVRPMARNEIDALPILAAGAAMRFLTTRLYDWLSASDAAMVVPKNPVEYFRRLRFNQQC